MSLYKKFYEEFKGGYYMHATLGIIASSYLGSVAALLILNSGSRAVEMVELFWITTVCMSYNAAVLSNLNKSWVFNLLIISVLSSTLLTFYHLAVL